VPKARRIFEASRLLSCASFAEKMAAPKQKLSEAMVHLGLGATAVVQPAFTGMEWYADYAERTASDGKEGRLVSMHTFREPWKVWEMHPVGAEVVLCTKGTLTLIQDVDGAEREVVLQEGDYAVNPPGVWHTADADDEVTCVFITAGQGTEHKERASS